MRYEKCPRCHSEWSLIDHYKEGLAHCVCDKCNMSALLKTDDEDSETKNINGD